MTEHEAAVALFRLCKGHDPVLPPARLQDDVDARNNRDARSMLSVKSPLSPVATKPAREATARLPVAPPEGGKPAPVKPDPNPVHMPRQHALAHAMWLCHTRGQTQGGRVLVRHLAERYNRTAPHYGLKPIQPGDFVTFLKGNLPKLCGELSRRYVVNNETGRAVKIIGFYGCRFIKSRIGIALEG